MKNPVQLINAIAIVRNPLAASPLRRGFLLIALALGLPWLALSPAARAVCQEGCLTDFNTVLGDDALLNNTGVLNTAISYQALFNNTNGSYNTASGVAALKFNTTGSNNTASGYAALQFNTTGYSNTASGYLALYSNTTGSNNTASGLQALFNNTTGGNNTAYGRNALVSNTSAANNTVVGYLCMNSNSVGAYNTATGLSALYSNTSGSSNSVAGVNALYSNTTGTSNSALGRNALVSNTSGSNNIAVGLSAGGNLTSGSNNIMIGNVGVGGESGRIRIGVQGTQTSTYIGGISGVTVAGGVGVVVDSSGHLGTLTSSARYKEAIAPMGEASEAILALEPVTFRYKAELDPKGIPQFGLVAEEVAKVDPDLVARDESGKPYTVRYEAVNAMLLNEFLKEHRRVESLEKAIAEQHEENVTMRTMLKEQAAEIQKVSDQLGPQAPRVVATD